MNIVIIGTNLDITINIESASTRAAKSTSGDEPEDWADGSATQA